MLKNLHPQTLTSNLNIENCPDAPLPRFLQADQFTMASLLRNLPLLVDLRRSLLGLSELLLQLTQDLLQLRVSNQPGILAVLFQQSQVLMALREMRARCVRLL